MPHALIVDDDADSREALASIVAGEGYTVAKSDSLRSARVELVRRAPDIVLVDLKLPDGNGMSLVRDLERPLATDVVLVTGHASLDSAIEGLRLGASDYLTKPVNVERLTQLLRRQPRVVDLKQEIGELRQELRRVGHFGHLVGNSPPMQELFDRIARVARTSAPVLLLGEKGTGKELAARTIHDLSRRRRAPYLVLECSSLPSQMIEGELFGRERNIAIGLEHRHVGLLERAHGGTVLLDKSHCVAARGAGETGALHGDGLLRASPWEQACDRGCAHHLRDGGATCKRGAGGAVPGRLAAAT